MQSEQNISPDAQVTYLVADNDESGYDVTKIETISYHL
jgi:hypothetical protein